MYQFQDTGTISRDVAVTDMTANTRSRTAALLAERDPATAQPEWFRAPSTGYSRYVEISRPKLYQLAADGLIRSCSLREPGQIRGTPLFHLESVLAYCLRCEQAALAAEQSATAADAADTSVETQA